MHNNNSITSYINDSNTDNLLSVSKDADGKTVTNSYTCLNDRISSITHNGFSYNFGYDALGNNTTVSAGSQNLITNVYEARTSLLQQSNYGNGQNVSSSYDSLDRVIARSFNGSERYKYSYGYDKNNNASSLTDKINNVVHTTSYIYDKDNRPTETDLAGGGKVTQRYENNKLGRVEEKTVNTGSTNFNTTYTYKQGANGSTSTKIDTMSNGTLGAIAYTYDANGNIETITQGGNQIKYNYNELNEVIREDNQVLNKTIVYAYDVGGNITSKTEYAYTTGTPGTPTKTVSYNYGDTNWKDKLTSYDGKAITYDAIGNPLTYDGWTYTWEEGRQLKTAV